MTSQKIYIPTLLIGLILSFNLLYAGKDINLLLKSGTEKISEQAISVQLNEVKKGTSPYKIITFKSLPSNELKVFIGEIGIRLYHYLPKNSYYAWIPENLNENDLVKLDLHAITEIKEKFKFHPLAANELPEWAFDSNKGISLVLSYFDDRSTIALINDLTKINAEVIHNDEATNRVYVSISERAIPELLSLNYIYYIEAIDPPSLPENYGGRQQHRSNMLAQDFNNGFKYDGSGISIGMHDDGIIGPHIDYEGRLPLRFVNNNNGDHGDHVAGTIMGAGNLDPDARGMAFGADLYVYGASNNNYDSVTNHYNNYDVIITSKSYSNGCNAGYTSLSRKLDQQTRQLPSLIHVFSAGNNGTSNCNYGAGAGWGNITGGHKMGKNVVTTGNLNSSDGLANSSSRGPASDGRIKPDICAKGTAVNSTIDENDYGLKTGTSMSCPGISGSFGQLYHAYKELNGNQNPPSALMKGTVLNTADDLGNPGPDYKFGWGRINLRRALEVLNQNQYITGQISSSPITHTIAVPAGLEQVRIMIYWHDFEASTSAAQAIVNNIDMSITDPSNNTILPWVLNPAPNATTLNANATRAIDSLNNMEQVTIDAPVAGNYTVNLNPTAIPQGPQDYYVIYEFVYNEIFLTYPNGGEGLVPFESETVRWDAFGNTGSFTLEYSTNGGTSWTTISSTISGSNRQYTWNPPNLVTDQLKLRISRGLKSDESDADISLIRVPQNLNVDWICPDSLQLSWSSVASATSYRAYQLGAKYMDSTGTASGNSFVYRNMQLNEKYWISVSANASAASTGKRAWAIQTSGVGLNCPLEDDAAISMVTSPDPSTYFDCNLPEFSTYVKNAGTNIIQSVPVRCVIDGNIILSGSTSAALASGDSAYVKLSEPLGFSNGLHNMKCYVAYANDPNAYNDSTELIYFNIKSGTVVSIPWEEDFENMTNCGTQNNCGNTYCKLTHPWVNDSTYLIDDHDWRVDDGGTPSNGTGPSFDHKPGNTSGNYVFTEASGGCDFSIAQMVSPCMSLKDLVEPHFSYWYHMYGQNIGELHVDIMHNGKWRYDAAGYLWGNRGDNWFNREVDLAPYIGDTINLRFRGITGDGFASDMALDDMRFFDKFDPTGINEVNSNELTIHPNPANKEVWITWNDIDIKTIELNDLSGKSLNSISVEELKDNSLLIDVSTLNPGVYIITLKGSDTIYSERLIVL